MEKINSRDQEENIERLMRLASAVFKLAQHTNDPRRLELLRKIAAPLQSLLDESEDDLGHPDLGLELNEYVRIKEHDEHDESGWVQMFGEATDEDPGKSTVGSILLEIHKVKGRATAPSARPARDGECQYL